MLDDVADTDDADKFAVSKHEQMPHTVARHQAHGALQGIAGGNRDDGPGGYVPHFHGKRSLAMGRNGMDDVAFRYETGDGVTAGHDQRGDAPCAHTIGCAFDRLGRADRDDAGAFAIQNTLNAHDLAPVSFRSKAPQTSAARQGLACISHTIGRNITSRWTAHY